MEYILRPKKEVDQLDYEKQIRHMLRTLADNPDCGYAKDFVRFESLRNGQRVRVSLLIEVDKSDLMD